MKSENLLITEEMLARYYDLNRIKKEIEAEMSLLKQNFHSYMDSHAGENHKGEAAEGGFKLLRQIRKAEKYNDRMTVDRLYALNLEELVQVVKRPDSKKIDAAIKLGLLQEEELEDCKEVSYTKAIAVKRI